MDEVEEMLIIRHVGRVLSRVPGPGVRSFGFPATSASFLVFSVLTISHVITDPVIRDYRPVIAVPLRRIISGSAVLFVVSMGTIIHSVTNPVPGDRAIITVANVPVSVVSYIIVCRIRRGGSSPGPISHSRPPISNTLPRGTCTPIRCGPGTRCPVARPVRTSGLGTLCQMAA